MQRRPVRRALVAALTTLILMTVAAYADSVPADGDALTPGNQSLVVLPDATPGQVVTWPITFRLVCGALSHVAPGTTIELDLAMATVPLDGHASATSTSIGPVPATWAPSGEGCDDPAPSIAADGPSTVSLTMPTSVGDSYLFTLFWSRIGATNLTGSTAITFQVNVVPNTPPTIHVPADITAEATSPDGAEVTWSATATDNEDATPPTPTCAPASGSTFPLGTTTVHCSVTDGGGLKDSGSFTVTVEDTTPPKLFGMPVDQNLTTGDQNGTTLTYDAPTARDAADSSPDVSCSPASGSQIPVGTTTVTCTARDATGNHASDSFSVHVTYVSPVTWTATWGEPVATVGATFVANLGRSVPVKVEMFANGVEQTQGRGLLSLASCDGKAAGSIDLTWDGGRWNGKLDTSTLGAPGCYLATASLDGNVAGAFRIDLRGSDQTAVSSPKKITPKP
jgi:hypothetical protein